MRLIHTADWQIGKVFRFVDQATMGVLQEARLEAISAIGRLALEHAAPVVLVAGDIYDIGTAEDRTLAQPLVRMRAFASVEWHLIPGNHDPHHPGGPWDRLLVGGCRRTSGCTSSRRPWRSRAAQCSCCPRRFIAGARSAIRPPGWTRRPPPRERPGSASRTARSAPSARTRARSRT